jgi:hypothetical protein
MIAAHTQFVVEHWYWNLWQYQNLHFRFDGGYTINSVWAIHYGAISHRPFLIRHRLVRYLN